MDHSAFTPVSSTIGGLLIGLSAALLLVSNGRIAGISGILAGTLPPRASDGSWRLFFLVGLVGTGGLYALIHPAVFPTTLSASAPFLVVAGLLVGYGTSLGGGCTSGHGVCGIARLSLRSLVATITFMVTGGIAVFAMHALRGGR